MTDEEDGSKEWKTLRVPKEARDKALKQKEEAGRTWGEQIVRPDGVVGLQDINLDADPGTSVPLLIEGDGTIRLPGIDDLAGEIERLRETTERVPERTADELEGRLR